MIDSKMLPEGTEWRDFMTPSSADSPVGKCVVARILQYEVREGGEARQDGRFLKMNPGRLPGSLHIAVVI